MESLLNNKTMAKKKDPIFACMVCNRPPASHVSCGYCKEKTGNKTTHMMCNTCFAKYGCPIAHPPDKEEEGKRVSDKELFDSIYFRSVVQYAEIATKIHAAKDKDPKITDRQVKARWAKEIEAMDYPSVGREMYKGHDLKELIWNIVHEKLGLIEKEYDGV